MKKIIEFEVEQDILDNFNMAAKLAGETPGDAIVHCMRNYISEKFSSISKQYAEPRIRKVNTSNSTEITEWYGKANNKIPAWAVKSNQYNHKIIRAFLQEEKLNGKVLLADLERRCTNINNKDVYVPTFKNNYAQMKADGPKTHGKVFVDDGYQVYIWDVVEETLRKYESYFID